MGLLLVLQPQLVHFHDYRCPMADFVRSAACIREPGPHARAVLLEANAYPAIGSGTMTAVPEHVYTRLVGDMLGVLVSEALRLNGPAADALGCGEWAQALVGGGFRKV